jgi:glycosyltransferase involved in cell wall biosynthesis
MVYHKFPLQKVVSISDAQRIPLPVANYIATVYHGLPADLYQAGTGGGGYLAFLGRISPEKGIDSAIKIAIASGLPLKIAAKVDKVDRQYYEKKVRPLLKHPLLEFIGEIKETEKNEFLGNAAGVLFPINWPEPFGLVMIEAMACGTPVIAFGSGSVPEVIDEGLSGFIVNSIRQAVSAVARLDRLSRETVRAVFDKRFTVVRMADDYIRLYTSLLAGGLSSRAGLLSSGKLWPGIL